MKTTILAFFLLIAACGQVHFEPADLTVDRCRLAIEKLCQAQKELHPGLPGYFVTKCVKVFKWSARKLSQNECVERMERHPGFNPFEKQ